MKKHCKKMCLLMIIAVLFLIFNVPIYADTSANTGELIEQNEIVKAIADELILLRQLNIAVKQMKKNAAAIESNYQEIVDQQELTSAVAGEMALLRKLLKSVKEKDTVSSNLNQLINQTEKIKMVIRELQAMNKIVFAKSKRTEVSIQTDKIFNLLFTAENLKSSSNIKYTVEYDPYELTVVDLCNITAEPEITAPFTVGDVTVESFTESEHKGEIIFNVNKQLTEIQSWKGIVSGIKFKGKIDGNVVITTQID